MSTTGMTQLVLLWLFLPLLPLSHISLSGVGLPLLALHSGSAHRLGFPLQAPVSKELSSIWSLHTVYISWIFGFRALLVITSLCYITLYSNAM